MSDPEPTSEISAVALVRIPDWQAPDELDVRELDDSVMVFLEVPFDSDDNALLDALEDAIGDAMYDHEDTARKVWRDAIDAAPPAPTASPATADLPIGYIPLPQGLHPDTAKLVVRGTIRSRAPGEAELRLQGVEFASVPIPPRYYPVILDRLGRREEPGLDPGSIGLHRSLGFEQTGVGHSVGFKHGRWVDIVHMQKPLNGGDVALPDGGGITLNGH